MTSYLPLLSYVMVGTSTVSWTCLVGGWLCVQPMSVCEVMIGSVAMVPCRIRTRKM